MQETGYKPILFNIRIKKEQMIHIFDCIFRYGREETNCVEIISWINQVFQDNEDHQFNE